MINRNRTKSQYVFNSKTGMLEKVEDIKKISEKPKTTAKEDSEPVTSIMVVTAEDNIIHNYFYSFETSWDAINCLQIVTLKMPKMGQKNIDYWSNYTGQLTVYMGYNFTYDKVNANQFSTEQDAAESLARYWDNSKVKPYFRGEVDRIKEYKNDITIYVKNIGARFKQKIPEEFRQAFIYNQNVRDSFVAMCEFLGVPYICPPQTVTDEAGEETTEGETGNDGTENDVGQQVGTSQQLANQARNHTSKPSSNSSTSSSNSQASNLPNSSAANDENSTEEDGEEATEEGMDVEVNDIMNGYDDISFDANGAITHSSAVIEASPDIAHTLVALEENPMEKYLDDETGIIEKVQNFLDGEMFEELHNNVMNYDSITIEPKSAASSSISSTGTTSTSGDTSSGTGDSSSSGSSSSSSSNTGTTATGVGYVHRAPPQPSARAISDHKKPSTPTNLFSAISNVIWRRPHDW